MKTRFEGPAPPVRDQCYGARAMTREEEELWACVEAIAELPHGVTLRTCQVFMDRYGIVGMAPQKIALLVRQLGKNVEPER